MPSTLKLTYIGRKRRIQKRFPGCVTMLKFNGPPDEWVPKPTREDPNAGEWVPAKPGTKGGSVLLTQADGAAIANEAAAENRAEIAAGRNARWLIEEIAEAHSRDFKTVTFDPAGLKSHEAKPPKK